MINTWLAIKLEKLKGHDYGLEIMILYMLTALLLKYCGDNGRCGWDCGYSTLKVFN
jgi:hypothetical protein